MTAPAPSREDLSPSTAAIDAQASAVARTTLGAQAAVGTYLAVAGQDEEAWYDTDSVTQMAETMARLVDNFSVTAARFADQYIADAVAWHSGKRFRALGVRNTLGMVGENGVREGVSTAGLFGRAADTYRYQQSLLDKAFVDDVRAGAPSPTELASPLDAAINRARKAASTNLQLAVRNQSSSVLAEAGRRDLITGYRRVVHAELSEEGSCGLCIAASTVVYRTDHLMPMHPGCHCVPVPITKTRDPGAAINDADLSRFYDEAGGTSGVLLRETRYKVDEHGEIGPVLRPFGAPIRTAEEARRDANRRRTAKTDEQKIKTLQRKITVLSQSHAVASQMTLTPEWASRLRAIDARIGRLEDQVIRLGG